MTDQHIFIFSTFCKSPCLGKHQRDEDNSVARSKVTLALNFVVIGTLVQNYIIIIVVKKRAKR